MYLKEFRDEFLELLLSFLWRQWSLLGVGGYVESDDKWIIDPEALLIFSFSIARYDARLFDEIVDWLTINSKFINIQRFHNIIRKCSFSSKYVLSAVAEKMVYFDSRKKNKWFQLSEAYPNRNKEILFFTKTGMPLPVTKGIDIEFEKHCYIRNKLFLRKYSKIFDPEKSVSLILKLRALLGLNARCEILAYLADGRSVHPSKIARDIFYYQKTIQDSLVDMALSGLMYCSISGREKKYKLSIEKWGQILGLTELASNKWINWVRLFYGLEKIWSKMIFLVEQDFNSMLLASEIKELSKEVIPEIEESGFIFENKNLYQGKNIVLYFTSDVKKILMTLT